MIHSVTAACLLLASTLGAQHPVDDDALPTTTAVERRLVAMGTFLEVSIDSASRSTSLDASEAAVRAIEAVEARLSTWRADSELGRLNAAPVGRALELSDELASDLEAALYWWRATDGAFDPGIGALVEAWGLRSGGRSPAHSELDAILPHATLRELELSGSRATRLHAGFRIEEGAFGKGVGLDAALSRLENLGIESALLDLGGQVAVLGERDTTLRVAHPIERDRHAYELTVRSGSVATSGNSERGIVVDGTRRSHILDPRSGSPAEDFGSLTVWAPTATAADCLSTALFVMGPEAALEWARRRDDVEVLVLVRTADGLDARATRGLRERLTALPGSPAVRFTTPD